MFGKPIPAPKPNSLALSLAVENPGVKALSTFLIPGPQSIKDRVNRLLSGSNSKLITPPLE